MSQDAEAARPQRSRRLRMAVILAYGAALILLQAMTGASLRFSYLIPLMVPLAWLEGHGKKFLLDWSPFYVVILLYDAFRSVADELGMRVDWLTLPKLELAVFGGLPTVWAQAQWGVWLHGWLGSALFVVYLGHFLLPLLCFYVFWRTNQDAFRVTIYTITLLSLMGFMTFVLFPAAPPWMAAAHGVIPPVDHVLVHHLNAVFSEAGLPRIHVQLNPNAIAPMPSLHAAYPLALWLCLSRFAPRWRWLALANALAVAVTIVVFGEHYVVDVIAGWAYAIAAFAFTSWLFGRRSRRGKSCDARYATMQ